jgi:predicted Holliday junction resolvase-like endonuclease
MSAEELDYIRVTRLAEISNIRAKLLDMTGKDLEYLKRVHKLRGDLEALALDLDGDFKELKKQLEAHEAEKIRQSKLAEIELLEKRIENLRNSL